MRLLLLNQFVPPDPAPTAQLLGDLAEELRRRGHETVFVGDLVEYRSGGRYRVGRLRREAAALLRMLVRSWRVPGRVDALLCLTSPPMLPAAARCALLRHRRARLLHWAMDLYPEVAVALGEVRKRSLLHRVTEATMSSFYRACELVVVLDEDMAEAVRRRGVVCEVLPPWPPEIAGNSGEGLESGGNASDGRLVAERSGFRWLYSGNLGRAHEWRTLLEAQRRLEEAGVEATLCFQGGGGEREAAQRAAEEMGLRRCRWLPYARATDLLPSLRWADCLVATQRPETVGCLWPSKLSLALQLGQPLVWVGAPESAVARSLRGVGHACFAPGESGRLAEHLADLARSAESGQASRVLPSGEEIAERVRRVRQGAVASLADRIESACGVGPAVEENRATNPAADG